jgi:ABC-type lipoprotein release transport system permease subunit
MVVLGGILGAILGFLIALLFTEVIFSNPPKGSGFDWQLWTDVLLTIAGALAGSSLTRRFVKPS